MTLDPAPYFAQPLNPSREEASFYHTMDLPGGETVEGAWDLRGQFDRYVGNYDFSSRRVLDVGAASGYLSFEAEKRGAEVVSFDLADATMLDFLPGRAPPNIEDLLMRQRRGYWYCHHRLASNCKVFYGDPLRIDARLGLFDVAMIGNVLVHARDPLGILESVAPLVRHDILLIEHVLDVQFALAGFACMGDDVWWNFSPSFLAKQFSAMGFALLDRKDGLYRTTNGLEIACATLLARRKK